MVFTKNKWGLVDMQWFRDTGLGTKLTGILLIFLGVLLLSLIALLVYNTQSLTQEVANVQIRQELNTIVNRLEEIQSSIESDLGFLVADISFFQAVGRRSQNDLSEIIGRTRLASPSFDVEIVDGDGNFLVDTQADNLNSDDSELLNQSNKNEIQSFIRVQNIETQAQIYIASVSPIKSITRNFLGAIQVSQVIDSSILQDITSHRSDVFVGLIYNGQILVQNEEITSRNASSIFGIPISQEALVQNQEGEIAIIDELTAGNNTFYKVAYAPLSVDGLNSPISLLVLVELSQLNDFQSRTLNNTVLIFVILTLLTVLLIFTALRRLAIKPIENLRAGAQKMVEGDYNQLISVSGQDELGQLASTFNTMVNAIQEREVSLKASQIEAERANQVKSAFLASMSHELRTPLNAIINFSSFVADGDIGPVNDEQKEILGDVVRSGKHLLNLINDVLDMSKIEAGSLVLFMSDNLNINEILKDLVPTTRGLLADKPVEVHTKLDENIPLIRGDKQRITQVVINLVSNACKFTEKGAITLESKQQAENIIISVRDTGSGIEPEQRENIFKPFIQSESGIRQGGGTGLGLAISKSLVEAHHGSFWVESNLGHGSTFSLSLPIKL
jgi:signal transduction histidine kinase